MLECWIGDVVVAKAGGTCDRRDSTGTAACFFDPADAVAVFGIARRELVEHRPDALGDLVAVLVEDLMEVVAVVAAALDDALHFLVDRTLRASIERVLDVALAIHPHAERGAREAAHLHLGHRHHGTGGGELPQERALVQVARHNGEAAGILLCDGWGAGSPVEQITAGIDNFVSSPLHVSGDSVERVLIAHHQAAVQVPADEAGRDGPVGDNAEEPTGLVPEFVGGKEPEADDRVLLPRLEHGEVIREAAVAAFEIFPHAFLQLGDHLFVLQRNLVSGKLTQSARLAQQHQSFPCHFWIFHSQPSEELHMATWA